jgi:hypothetical protein
LDLDGLARQRDRYRALGQHVIDAERRPGHLSVRFDDATDLALLREAIDVERGCCPFFKLSPDAQRRTLQISVGVPEQDPALDALAHALGLSESLA